MKISAFPKAFQEAIIRQRSMTVFDWIEMARGLHTEGIELHEGFFDSLDDSYVDRVADAIHQAGFVLSLMCCSPDLSHPDSGERQRAIDHEAQMIRVTRRMGGSVCRVLTGQRRPEVSVEQGVEWVAGAINQLIEVARENKVVLGLENHYKEGYWQYPEFAQKQEVFLRVLEAIPERDYFGVQYDPSNAVVAGDDPVELLRLVVDRVVSMHASDRYLLPGHTLDDMRQHDGTLGYPEFFMHGVTGQGLNDYDAIFSILSEAGYSGWVSIEDGVNGLDEMQQSLDFLHMMRDKYFAG
jgi:sugar phosphate isomerase/epimerase